MAQIITYIGGTVAYATFLSGIAGISETEPGFRVFITSSLMLLLVAVGLLSIHPSSGVVEPLYSRRIGGYTGRVLVSVMIGAITIISFIIIISRNHIPFSREVLNGCDVPGPWHFYNNPHCSQT